MNKQAYDGHDNCKWSYGRGNKQVSKAEQPGCEALQDRPQLSRENYKTPKPDW